MVNVRDVRAFFVNRATVSGTWRCRESEKRRARSRSFPRCSICRVAEAAWHAPRTIWKGGARLREACTKVWFPAWFPTQHHLRAPTARWKSDKSFY
jgi:hypothetical protein